MALTDQLEQAFAREMKTVPWMLDALNAEAAGGEPDFRGLALDDAVLALTTAVVALQKNILLIAAEIDRQNASR
jgi:hypothetical protein